MLCCSDSSVWTLWHQNFPHYLNAKQDNSIRQTCLPSQRITKFKHVSHKIMTSNHASFCNSPLLSGFQSLMTCCYMHWNLITLYVWQSLRLFNISRLQGFFWIGIVGNGSNAAYNTWRKQPSAFTFISMAWPSPAVHNLLHAFSFSGWRHLFLSQSTFRKWK